MEPAIDDVIKEIRREISIRKSVYPKWIAAKKMKQDKADWQIACLDKALKILEKSRTTSVLQNFNGG